MRSSSSASRGADGVGQVELALGIVAPQPVQRREDPRRRQHVETRVDATQRELAGACVGGFHQSLENRLVVLAPHHAAQRSGLPQTGHRERAPGSTGALQKPLQGRAGNQGHVAGQDQKPRAALDRARDLGQGVAGSELSLLKHPFDIVRRELGAHTVRLMTDDADNPPAAGAAGGLENPAEKGSPRDPMEHLGGLGFHPFAHPRRQDHGNDRALRRATAGHRTASARFAPAR